MAFDPQDIYDAAALYDMWLNCQGCPTTFDFEPDRPIGLDYYHDIGQKAKRDGWIVAEQINGAHPDEQSYLVLCPACAARYGLTLDNARSDSVPRAIEEILSAMDRAARESAA